mgnify:CR=1 FL=1
MLSKEPQWVAVYTSSRAEKQVCRRLTEMGVENYVPMRRVRHRWSDRVKIVEEPLITSYVFARIKDVQVVPVRELDGVVWLVSFHGEVATIPDEQIDAMRQFVESEKAIAIYETSRLREGATVMVMDGPFEGRKGVIISDCEGGNFAIRIDALSISLVVYIDQNLLHVCQKDKKSKGLFHKND